MRFALFDALSGRSRGLGSGVLAATFLLLRPTAAAAAPLREALDQQDVDRMKAAVPRAVDLLERGESLAGSGHVEEADALFKQGLELDKSGALLLRRHCEALTSLGRREEAIKACYHALESLHSNANVRATVQALVSGPSAPPNSFVSLALDLAVSARNRAPGNLAPIAAMCDIASSLGDGIMLQHCAQELERSAPGTPDAERAMALLETRWPPWRFWVGWSAIFAVVLGTALHALGRWVRRLARRSRDMAVVAGVLVTTTLTAVSRPAAAATESDQPQPGMFSKWHINDDDPESSIPPEADRQRDPLQFGYWLQDVIMRGEVYAKHGKHETAVKMYRALALAVPERAIAFEKVCQEYEALGDLPRAQASCALALYKEGGVLNDYIHYVRLVLATPGTIPPAQLDGLTKVLAHLRDDPNGRAVADELECDIAVRTQDTAQLEQCVGRLNGTAPNDPRTLAYGWSLAMLKGDLSHAEELLARARSTPGVKPESIAGMQGELARAQSGHGRVRAALTAVAAALALAAMAVLAVAFVRRRTSLRPA